MSKQMQKNHKDLIKQDQQDLEQLDAQVKKVQKLKREHTKQREEIGSLKNIIQELRSENQELRSKSKSKENLGDRSESSRKGKGKGNSCRFSGGDSGEGSGQQFLNSKRQKMNSKNLTVQQRQKQRKQTKQQLKTKPKIWNTGLEKQNKKNQKGPSQLTLLRTENPLPRKQYPQPSLRNHSGFISSGKFLSPQARTHNETWRFRHAFDQISYSEQSQEPRLDITHIQTKTKLVNNLISDLQLQLSQNQSQLAHEQQSHKHTRKHLKTLQTENNTLTQLNNKLYSSHQILEKENEFLKQQLMRLTENKIKYETANGDFGVWLDAVARRVNQEFQVQFREMDRIYCQFQGVYGWKRAHS